MSYNKHLHRHGLSYKSYIGIHFLVGFSRCLLGKGNEDIVDIEKAIIEETTTKTEESSGQIFFKKYVRVAI